MVCFPQPVCSFYSSHMLLAAVGDGMLGLRKFFLVACASVLPSWVLKSVVGFAGKCFCIQSQTKQK